MAKVVLAPALTRWLPSTEGHSGGELRMQLAGGSVGELLQAAFARHPSLRGYVLDEHGAVRHHVAVFIDGQCLRDKRDLGQPVQEDAELYVMQALSGG
ncbi:MoaD/ThiS family protein [Pseudoxanthomonas beigongshangi]